MPVMIHHIKRVLKGVEELANAGKVDKARHYIKKLMYFFSENKDKMAKLEAAIDEFYELLNGADLVYKHDVNRANNIIEEAIADLEKIKKLAEEVAHEEKKTLHMAA